MNLMPTYGKICSFDCVYCECGYNQPVQQPQLPSRQEVCQQLEQKLQSLAAEAVVPDVITFSGNGEPTLHPDFEGIIEDTCRLRDQYCPSAKVSVLSNSTQLSRPDVVRALRLCDNRILKLDSAVDKTMRLIDAPLNKQLSVADIVRMLEQFDGDFTLQTCFLRGKLSAHYGEEFADEIIDNTTPEELRAWYDVVERLHPKQVMIYVIDRATPEQHLHKIAREEMERIAAPLREKGLDVSISA